MQGVLVLCLLAVAGQALAVDFPKSTLSGYLSTGSEEGGELFYMFYESQVMKPHIVDDTPIMIWLNGGPGCSSMIGNFYEIGPQRVNEEGQLLNFDYTWNKNFALLFIDQPIGTGLSQGGITPSTRDGVTEALYTALNQFFIEHAVYKSRPVFLAGESYAGHYIPSLAQYVLNLGRESRQWDLQKQLRDRQLSHKLQQQQIKEKQGLQHIQMEKMEEQMEKMEELAQTPGGYLLQEAERDEMKRRKQQQEELHPQPEAEPVPEPHQEEQQEEEEEEKERTPAFRLAGIAIGSGLTEPREQVQTHADVLYSMGLIDEMQRERARQMQDRVVELIDANYYELAHNARDDLLQYLEEKTGVATLLDIRRQIKYRDFLVSDYLNRDEVREKIGAKQGGDMSACNDSLPKILTTDIMMGHKHEISRLLEEIPVLLFQGQFDAKDGYAGNLEWIHQLKWRNAEDFRRAPRQIWELEGERVGYWKEFGHLSHAVVLGAGHLVPHDAPEASFDMIEKFVGGALDRMYGN